MAKGEQKSNREKRKPKADKQKPVPQTSGFSSGQSSGGGKSGSGKKGR